LELSRTLEIGEFEFVSRYSKFSTNDLPKGVDNCVVLIPIRLLPATTVCDEAADA